MFAPDEVQKSIKYEHITLDAKSQATADKLDETDFLVAYIPTPALVIADGPQKCVLSFLLLGNDQMAKRVNGFAEEHRVWSQLGLFIGFVAATFAATEGIPLYLTWLSILSLGDTLRCFCKLVGRTRVRGGVASTVKRTWHH